MRPGEVGLDAVRVAARVGRPVVVGPSMSNFADITRLFLQAGALVQAPDAATAQAEIVALFGDPPRRARLGEAALRVLAHHRGAVDRTMQEVEHLIETSVGPHGASGTAS